MHPMIMGTTSEKTKPLRLRDQIIIFSLLNICSNSFVKIKVNRTFSIVKKYHLILLLPYQQLLTLLNVKTFRRFMTSKK